MEENTALNEGRSRRTSKNKSEKLAAFEKLKALKGTKHKYEIIEEARVYEEVTEKEYSRLVQERQEDDWIVDDNGIGYCEDGREIFDDDIEENVYTDKKAKQPPKKNFSGPKKNSSKSSDIKNLFKTVPVKRKNEDVKLDDDDILGSIMEDLHKETVPVFNTPKPMLLRKKHKFNHPSPVQRYQINPFSKDKGPLASEFVPKLEKNIKSDSQISHRAPIKPKVVDFDNCQNNDWNGSEVIEEFSQDPDFKPSKENEVDIKDSLEMDFDPSGDIFIEEENSSVLENLDESPAETKPVSETESKNICTFQGTFSAENCESAIPDVNIDAGHLPLITNNDGNSVLRFFLLDAFEDSYKHPGIVYLFGKIFLEDVKTYVSCCVTVKDVPRRVYFLPRETEIDVKTKQDTGKAVTMQDLYSEVNSILEKMKISEFRSKKSMKKYAFGGAEIPDACEYLEVHYPANFPPLPSDLSGATFSHVLGVDSTSMEMVLIEQKLKGPCWVDILQPQASVPAFSWCKVEASVSKLKNIICVVETLPAPPLTLMCLNLTTAVNSKTQQNEIVAVSCLIHHSFPLDKPAPTPQYQSHFCVLTKPSDAIFPYDFKEAILKYNNTKVERVDSERSLLIYLLAKINKLDPDLIMGHDVLSFVLDILLHRMVVHKVPNWSRIGRLRRAGMPRLNNAQGGVMEKNSTCGRLLCDVKISSKELIRCKSYDLEELSNHILNQQYTEIPSESIQNFYSSSKQLFQLIDHSMLTAELILRICCELNVLPLALQVTNITGCIMSRTLLGGRSERNEYLLLHAFHAQDFIFPPKSQGKKAQKVVADDELEITSKQGRRKPAYEGGLVLDPKKGFYDKYILLMDFNSLYPSIIQEYNICFTTMPRAGKEAENNSEEELIVSVPDPGLKPGVLPTEIRKLVESRKQVKQMMKATDVTKERYAQYDIRQRALKLTANSMYGCLGFSHSRFYAKALAALVTRKGREILLKTKELVERMGLDVIYGDTDSIMINTNQVDLDEVNLLGNKVKNEVNKLYKLLEIDIDGIYKPMLLLKKKKYAALSVTRLPNNKIVFKEEIKGLDIVRRDWSQLAKESGQFIIKEILSNKSKEDIVENIHQHLRTLGEEVSQGRKPLSDYIIYKQLTKNPEDYPNKKNLPHVLVAIRVNEKGGKKLRMGDTVSFIICLDGSDGPAMQRAYHPDELKSNENLKIDVSYYLSQQIHPVISRLCAPIEGTDAGVIADCLGLDSSKYQSAVREAEEEEDKLLNPSSLFDDKDRFQDCEKLVFVCPASECYHKIVIDDILVKEPNSISCILKSCANCKTSMVQHIANLKNQLQKTIRQFISKYYKLVLICEDVGCAYETRKVPLRFTSGGPICSSCRNSNLHLKYTEAQLYTQLAYFQHLFDLDKAVSSLTDEEKILYTKQEDVAKVYTILKCTIDQVLRNSAYGIVNLTALFHGLYEQDLNK
ncbi:DNA polymerase alpha catalytic subunit-like [Uloborus diversus]|uniref:DNA polymerase alpha catalytic subunit-like n=1 Tax=Uloborus diversus TaxID=327109 RepID=UPI00240A7991|nr:DNA polymerase alpha catalytic subunit-like [Uloborus diversus]